MILYNKEMNNNSNNNNKKNLISSDSKLIEKRYFNSFIYSFQFQVIKMNEMISNLKFKPKYVINY